jgi:hypothetical protein
LFPSIRKEVEILKYGHYRTEDIRWKREKREHRGPSLEATNMMVDLSQCHADKRVWANEFSGRPNPMKLIDPKRLDLFTTIVIESVSQFYLSLPTKRLLTFLLVCTIISWWVSWRFSSYVKWGAKTIPF